MIKKFSITLLVTCYLLLVTSVHASHLAGEGWGCIDNSIYYQNPKGVDEIFKDCTDNQGCRDISDPDYASNTECVDINQESSTTEQPSPTPSTSPPTSGGVTSEEQAIYNLNKGLLPSQVIKDNPIKEPNILQKILDAVGSFFGLFWSNKVENEPKLYSQSDSIHQAEIPQQVETKSDSPLEKLEGFLGGSTGFYGASIPRFGNNNDIKSSECLYENASFPAGINPVTGREC